MGPGPDGRVLRLRHRRPGRARCPRHRLQQLRRAADGHPQQHDVGPPGPDQAERTRAQPRRHRRRAAYRDGLRGAGAADLHRARRGRERAGHRPLRPRERHGDPLAERAGAGPRGPARRQAADDPPAGPGARAGRQKAPRPVQPAARPLGPVRRERPRPGTGLHGRGPAGRRVQPAAPAAAAPRPERARHRGGGRQRRRHSRCLRQRDGGTVRRALPRAGRRHVQGGAGPAVVGRQGLR